MGVVDTIMVGSLGPTAIAAVSIGNAGLDVLALFGIGLLLGLDTVVSRAFGAGREPECREWLWQGAYIALVLSPPLALLLYGFPLWLPAAGVNAAIVAGALPYSHAVFWSLPPLLLYSALRRYLQGMGVVRPIMFVLLSANAVNAVGNWLFLKPFGIAGIGWATVLSRIYLAAALAAIAVLRDPSTAQHIPRPSWTRIRTLLGLGVPAALQLLLEVGVFAAVTVLAGRLTAYSLAAHHIAVNIAGATFMVPLGISSAGAVAVGQAIGAGDGVRAKKLGWLTLGCGAAFMFAAAIALWTVPDVFVRIFTSDTALLRVAVPLMLVAAVFQTFDGIQVTATGILRGAGDTRTPMFANLVGHWAVGLPLGYALCFWNGRGVIGLWIGLCAGLVGVATLLLVTWSRAKLERRGPDPAPSVATGDA